MDKKPYGGKYPTTARYLMEIGVVSAPRQTKREFNWAEGIDISYALKNMTPNRFRKYADQFLLLAFQEMKRYDEYKWKFARFDVKLGRLKKGRDLPDIASFQSAMHDDPEIAVSGPGYEVPQRHFLYHKVEDILDIVRRYQGKVNTQNPFKVIRLVISIRQEW